MWRVSWYFSCVVPSWRLSSVRLPLDSYRKQMKQQLPESRRFHLPLNEEEMKPRPDVVQKMYFSLQKRKNSNRKMFYLTLSLESFRWVIAPFSSVSKTMRTPVPNFLTSKAWCNLWLLVSNLDFSSINEMQFLFWSHSSFYIFQVMLNECFCEGLGWYLCLMMTVWMWNIIQVCLKSTDQFYSCNNCRNSVHLKNLILNTIHILWAAKYKTDTELDLFSADQV